MAPADPDKRSKMTLSTALSKDRQPRKATRPLSFIGIAAIVITVFLLLPLLFVIWVAVQSGWSSVISLVFRPRVGDLLLNTVLDRADRANLGDAFGGAGLADRTQRSARSLFLVMAGGGPLAVPPSFVHSYAWISLVPKLHGLSAGTLIATIAYFSLCLPADSRHMRRLTRALKRLRASLGHSPWQVFFRVAATAAPCHSWRIAAAVAASADRIRAICLHPV